MTLQSLTTINCQCFKKYIFCSPVCISQNSESTERTHIVLAVDGLKEPVSRHLRGGCCHRRVQHSGSGRTRSARSPEDEATMENMPLICQTGATFGGECLSGCGFFPPYVPFNIFDHFIWQKPANKSQLRTNDCRLYSSSSSCRRSQLAFCEAYAKSMMGNLLRNEWRLTSWRSTLFTFWLPSSGLTVTFGSPFLF